MSIQTRCGATSDRSSLAALAARIDLGALVERYSGPGRASGGTLTFTCPSPAHPDHSPSFTVSRDKSGRERARCWSQCDFHGDALDFLQWIEGLDTARAAERLRQILGEPGSFTPLRKKKSTAPPKPARVPLVDTARRPDPETARRFLEQYLDFRCWPADMAERFGLEVVLDSSETLRVRHPFMAPTASGTWEALYWQDRGPKASRVRWLSPRGAAPIPYNLPALERDDLEAVVLCEGPADTITAALALEEAEHVACIGVPGAGAWRPEWAPLLEGLRVVIAADNDAAGERLEDSVRSSVRRPVAVMRPRFGDLTETVSELGLSAVSGALLDALATLPEAAPRSQEERDVRRLLELFPEARLVRGGAS